MSSVKIVIRKDKLNKNGTHPIHFRIISSRKIKYIASSISVKLEQWNEVESKVIKIQNSARINAYLTKKFGELQNSVLEVETNTKSVTQRILKEKIYGKKPLNFFEFTEKLIEQYYDVLLKESILKKTDINSIVYLVNDKRIHFKTNHTLIKMVF